MKTIQTLLLSTAALLFATATATAATSQQQQAARGVIQRFCEQAQGSGFCDNVRLSSQAAEGGCPTYRIETKENTLHISGSDGVALCKGFYDFVTSQGIGIASWSGNRFAPPAVLPEGVQMQAVSPVAHHYYLNVVTFGYSTAYWDWPRWEQEIDWMALHGIDMPLALVATEAISARVFQRLGLTEEEISAWFTGPAHLPWLRMGNISGHDGPLPREWHEGQVRLQHQILSRMRELGMTPICPGFSGFVPPSLSRLYPNATITKTHWGGHFNNYMLSPDDPLFAEISRMYIEEWEKEFGKCSHYLMDSFNEMEIPFPPHGKAERYEQLARYGETSYRAMEQASPGATWAMQGWMFGYQRDIWDERSLAALLSRVPDDKMLLLDMAVDYNRHFWRNGTNYELHKGFYGKPWVYSVIPNMGGKTGLTGMLDFYANGHLHALAYPGRGHLLGMGMAPEGIENNEVIYELMSSAGWRRNAIELDTWLRQYNRCRYGATCPALEEYWRLMQQSVYGSFTDNPRYIWQSRPGRTCRGSINANQHFHAAVLAFSRCAEEDPYRSNPLYIADLIELTAASLGGRIEELMHACEAATREGRTEEAARLEADITELMLGMDKLLASHPTHRMERWISFARNLGSTPEQKDYYEGNARRLVTIWGPPVDDYAAKVWSGLIRDYYLPRWLQYRRQGKAGLSEWEKHWVEKERGLSPCTPYADPLMAALQLQRQARSAVSSAAQADTPAALGYWTEKTPGRDWEHWELNANSAELKQAHGLRFVTEKGDAGIEIAGIRIIMDGREVVRLEQSGKGIPVECRFRVPEDAQGNNECRLIIRARNTSGSHGRVELIREHSLPETQEGSR